MDRSQWHKWIFWYVCVVNQIRNLLMSREVIWKCKHQRSWTKLSRVRKGIEKASYRLIDSLWSTRQLLFAECLFVACCVYRLWLFSLTARCSLGTVLTGMKPEVRYTSVASVVSLFVYRRWEENVANKSHLRSSRSTTYMASHAYYTPPVI